MSKWKVYINMIDIYFLFLLTLPDSNCLSIIFQIPRAFFREIGHWRSAVTNNIEYIYVVYVDFYECVCVWCSSYKRIGIKTHNNRCVHVHIANIQNAHSINKHDIFQTFWEYERSVNISKFHIYMYIISYYFNTCHCIHTDTKKWILCIISSSNFS